MRFLSPSPTRQLRPIAVLREHPLGKVHAFGEVVELVPQRLQLLLHHLDSGVGPDSERTKLVDPPKGCKGPKQERRSGVWKGKIRFKGEGGYTKVRARKAKGTVLLTRNLKCHGPKPRTATVLNAAKVIPATNTLVNFNAAQVKGRSGRTFVASEVGTLTKTSPVTFIRSVSLTGLANTFTHNGLVSAHVKPPNPFSGSGDFHSSPSGSSWTGPLAVDLPGDSGVKLTGSGFIARLQQGTSF
jgi:hypothetical protein